MFRSLSRLSCLAFCLSVATAAFGQNSSTPIDQLRTGMSRADAIRILGIMSTEKAIITEIGDVRVHALFTRKDRIFSLLIIRQIDKNEDCEFFVKKYMDWIGEEYKRFDNRYCVESRKRGVRIDKKCPGELRFNVQDRDVERQDDNIDLSVDWLVAGLGFCDSAPF